MQAAQRRLRKLAAVLGASVTAVASSDDKLEVAKSFGATKLVNHRAGPLRDALKEALPGGSDVVVDPVGGSLAEASLRSLGFGGRFVTVGYASGEIPRIPLNLVLLKGCQIHGFQFATFGANLPDEMHRNEQELLELFAAGRAFPYIGATYTLDEVVEAMRFVAEGKAIGKVALDLS